MLSAHSRLCPEPAGLASGWPEQVQTPNYHMYVELIQVYRRKSTALPAQATLFRSRCYRALEKRPLIWEDITPSHPSDSLILWYIETFVRL